MKPDATEEVELGAPQAWLAACSPWRRRAVAFAAGAICDLGLAPFYFWPAMALGIVVFVWLLDGAARLPNAERIRAAFGRGWWFGFGYFCAGLYWIGSAFLVDPERWAIFLPFAVTAAPAGMALFWGGGAVAAMPFWTADWRRAPVFALAIFGAEWVRGHIFGGFPWNFPGYVWQAGGAMSQAAAWIGIYGLTLLTLLAFAAPATAFDRGAAGARRMAPALIAALGLGLVWGAGGRMLTAPQPKAAGIVVRLTESGLSQRDKWRPGNEWRVLGAYMKAGARPHMAHADVEIWPESAAPVLLLEQPDMLEAIGQALGDGILVTGTVRAERAAPGKDARYYNSAVVFDDVGGALRIVEIYNKHRLVPFGEFIPLWGIFRHFGLTSLQEIGDGFTAGPSPQKIFIPGAPPAAILICYEAIFPGLVPRGADRPQWIISVTNDSWFGNGTGPWQHYNQGRYRAIEEGLPMARAASGGVTAMVDARGRQVAVLETRGGSVAAALPGALPPTPYAQWGGFLLAGVGIALGLMRLAPGPASERRRK